MFIWLDKFFNITYYLNQYKFPIALFPNQLKKKKKTYEISLKPWTWHSRRREVNLLIYNHIEIIWKHTKKKKKSYKRKKCKPQKEKRNKKKSGFGGPLKLNHEELPWPSDLLPALLEQQQTVNKHNLNVQRRRSSDYFLARPPENIIYT